ncbi:MAG TPA: polysaccharide biosynthesis protein [Firmicutes bacterium]|jgi:O-antigen/teichoic acid export membrane protein|nr:polysaccharide biosynthesis protein [Bacillota bacterium]
MTAVNYKKASSYYLVGNLFSQGMSFLTVPIFTRILSTYDYGVVTTYNSWIGILSMVMGFTLYMGIRAAFIDYKDKIDNFMSVTTMFTIISSALMGLFLFAGVVLLRINVSLTLVILCWLQGMMSALTENYSMYLMMQYRFKLRTVIMILPNLLSAIGSIIAILFVVRSNLYMGKIVPTAVINILFGGLVILFVFKKSKVLYNIKFLKYGLAVSSPLILHGIGLNILSQSDRTMITWLADASQTGIYSLVYNFSMLATVITASLDGVWVPWFTEKMKAQDINTLNKRAVDYVNLMTYAMVCLLLSGPEVLKILASPKYWEGINIIPPVVLANYLIFMYALYVNVEHFYKKTPYITLNTLLAAGSNLVLNYIFIPHYGYVAAAYATLASYLLSLVLHATYAKKLNASIYPLRTFLRPLVHILVTTVVFYLLQNMPVIRWSLMFVYLGAMFFREYKRIFEFFPEIEKKLFKKYAN